MWDLLRLPRDCRWQKNIILSFCWRVFVAWAVEIPNTEIQVSRWRLGESGRRRGRWWSRWRVTPRRVSRIVGGQGGPTRLPFQYSVQILNEQHFFISAICKKYTFNIMYWLLIFLVSLFVAGCGLWAHYLSIRVHNLILTFFLPLFPSFSLCFYQLFQKSVPRVAFLCPTSPLATLGGGQSELDDDQHHREHRADCASFSFMDNKSSHHVKTEGRWF